MGKLTVSSTTTGIPNAVTLNSIEMLVGCRLSLAAILSSSSLVVSASSDKAWYTVCVCVRERECVQVAMQCGLRVIQGYTYTCMFSNRLGRAKCSCRAD